MNYEYMKCCNNAGKGTLRNLYRDFGDIRHDANDEKEKVQAFISWWRAAVENETRGTYLFAEPVLPVSARQIHTSDEATEVLNDESQALIAIPINISKDDLHKMIHREVNKITHRSRGTAKRKIVTSRARYKLSKSPNVNRLKTMFLAYEMYINCKRTGKRLSNKEIAKELEIESKSSAYYDNGEFVSYRHSIDQEKADALKVSKYIGEAKKIIENVANGQFP